MRNFLHHVARNACRYFSVVLTPDSNRDHYNHFHLDIGPGRVCSVRSVGRSRCARPRIASRWRREGIASTPPQQRLPSGFGARRSTASISSYSPRASGAGPRRSPSATTRMLPAALSVRQATSRSPSRTGWFGFLTGVAVDRDRAGGAEPRRQRAAFDETREPQPLVEAALGAFGAAVVCRSSEFQLLQLGEGMAFARRGAGAAGRLRRVAAARPARRRTHRRPR